MKLIYKKISKYDYHQKYIEDDDKVPVGWTDNLDSLEIEVPVSNEELFREEADEIQKKITQGQNDISELQVAMTDIYETIQSKPNSEDEVEVDG